LINKRYEELQFIDDFMFCKILTTRPDLCKALLELVLDIKIREIHFPEPQKDINITYDAHGIRLDVYVDDNKGTIYDMEMQTTISLELPKRMRYYQGMIDLSLISRGESYSSLKKSYIIFFCTADPFGYRLPIYRFKTICDQLDDDGQFIELKDDTHKVVINPDCEREGLSTELNELLDLLQGKSVQSGLAFNIQTAVETAVAHDEWRLEYMTLHMKIMEERMEAKAEGKAEGLAEGLRISVSRMLASGMTSEQVASILEIDLNLVKEIETLHQG